MGRKGERHCIDKLIRVSGANHYDSDGSGNLYVTVQSKSSYVKTSRVLDKDNYFH
jgi:hypothetical protein